jgi:hypothetical protein
MEKDDDLDKPLMGRCIATMLISAILAFGARAQRNYDDCTPPCYEWVESGSGGGSGHCEPVFEVKKELLQCPTLEMESPGPPTCVCSPTGTASAVVAAPPFRVPQVGKCKTYYDPAECGEEEINDFGFEEYVWTWTVSGVQATPNAGSGQTAEFDYEVPEGSFNITVNFQLVGKPEKPDGCACEDVTVSGSGAPINGRGYAGIDIKPYTCPEPQVNGVAPPAGKTHISYATPILYCVQICSSPCSPKWRVEGWAPKLVNSIWVAAKVPVTDPYCRALFGDARDRTQDNIARTLAHEMKHCEIWLAFVNQFNAKIMNGPLFDTAAECEAHAAALLKEWEDGYKDLRQRNNSHCPDFAGEEKYELTECGEEKPSGSYYCQ